MDVVAPREKNRRHISRRDLSASEGQAGAGGAENESAKEQVPEVWKLMLGLIRYLRARNGKG